MNEQWKITFENDGKTCVLKGTTIASLMRILTDAGLLEIQLAHADKEMRKIPERVIQ